MATIRWCPIFPKWDSYQPLIFKDTSCSTYRTSFDRTQKWTETRWNTDSSHSSEWVLQSLVLGASKPSEHKSLSSMGSRPPRSLFGGARILANNLKKNRSIQTNGKKTYNILRWPCHRNFCDILAPWLAPSPLFRLRSAQPSRVFWIQRPTVNVVSNTWWGKWLRLLTHGGTWKMMTVILKLAEIVQLRESSDSIPLASQKWLGLLTIPWLIPARKKPRKCGSWITFGGFLKWWYPKDIQN